jgi:aldehyde dehydrogenase (NAD+)
MAIDFAPAQRFYINGAWVSPKGHALCDAIDPATEQVIGQAALGDARDVDAAVTAARNAFAPFAASSRAERVALLRRIAGAYQRRAPDIAEAIVAEIGAPAALAHGPQIALGLATIRNTIATLERFTFGQQSGSTLVIHEPIGVCGLITAWNWPMFLTCLKVMPALAAGCTLVLKPSEFSPLSAALFTEALHEAGVPPGVFNLVQGKGPEAGAALASHPDVDMISFTGSTRGGVEVARAAAPTIKRVVQELGGKSASILLPDADFPKVVRAGVLHCFNNSGQTCAVPSRMLVPADRHEEAKALARAACDAVAAGAPHDAATTLGPVANAAQYARIQEHIASGLAEGAQLIAGGPGRPGHLERGYFVRPTVFAGVRNDMRIACEEIFGPVLCILPYRDEEDAIAIANDSPYGLSGYVHGEDLARARRVARRLRTGTVNINSPASDPDAPIGGYRQSGNGREKGEHGLREFLETKALVGYGNPVDGEAA